MFICFINFYWHFIQGFSKITALISFLLKIIESSNLTSKMLKADNNKVISNSSSRTNKMVINLFRNSTHLPNIIAIRKFIFLIFDAKKVFNHL